ncbi:MAG: cytochrome c-type biogenesis CcmF C-terminal domain-containing protein, partial [Luteibacter sp.]
FVLLMAPAVLLLPFGPYLRWGRAEGRQLTSMALRASVAAVICAIVAAFFVQGHLRAIAGVAGAVWVGAGTLAYVIKRWREMPRGRRYPAEMAGMLVAHAGVAIFLIGVMLSESLSIERDVRLAPGTSASIGGYDFRFDGVAETEGPNWRADEGVVTIQQDGQVMATVHPQKRTYSRGQVQTESAIDAGLFRDIYVALGEPMQATDVEGAWALRLYYKPFVRWIWLGGLFMMLGGFLAAGERRFRARKLPATVAATATTPAKESLA